MAQYRGTLHGRGRHDISRLGHKTSGILVSARGWDIGASVALRWNSIHNRDEMVIVIDRGSNDLGSVLRKTFYSENGHIKELRQ